MRPGQTATSVLGREGELAALGRFLDGAGEASALVLTGEAGVGKTTLWEAAVAAARRRGRRVLTARASGAEARLSFVTLVDLLEGVVPAALDALPAPQRRALGVALLEDEPEEDEPPEPRAVALGLLGVLRRLAAEQPLVVAVDDVQWVDAASAGALSFAARRTGEDGRVLLLVTERAGSERPLALAAPEQLAVGALGRGEIRRLLADGLGLTVPRRLMDDVMAASGGNPLFALEVGRMLLERGVPWIGERLAVPAAVEELVRARIATLPVAVQSLVLAAALSPLRRGDLARIAPADVVEDAIERGALVVEGERVRLGHPLLGTAALARNSAAQQRAMHGLLADAVSEPVRRAHHLAQAAERPDAALAATVSAAAARARERGAAQDAADLSEHALRLTPEDAEERAGRVLALGDHLLRAARDERLRELLQTELPRLPPGRARVEAYLLLNEAAADSVASHRRIVGLALDAADDDPVLSAPALAERARQMVISSVGSLPEAERLATVALEAAPAAGPPTHRDVLQALAWVRALRGQPIDGLARDFAAVGRVAPHPYRAVERVVAVRRVWRGEVVAARELVDRLLAQAEDVGDVWSIVSMRLHRCELELRAGEWALVRGILDGWERLSDEDIVPPLQERLLALLAAGRGEPEEAERWAAAALANTERTGVVWDRLEAWRAQGVAALAAGDPAAAADALRRVWDHVAREGVDDPGAFPVAPDLVEALAQLEEVAEAEAVLERLSELATAQDHPWGLLGARRGRALLAPGDGDRAGEELRAVAEGYAALGLRGDAARTLLALGRLERRRRRWAAARDALVAAADAFDAQDAPGWAAQARAELERVGGRKPRSDPGELTPAERRVVELAAAGQSNKAIARVLVVSINTVEGHLTRAYAKLGVRSRGELARRLGASP